MTSGFTDNSISRVPMEGTFVVEYSLSLSDHHALDTFIFDKFLRKTARFRFAFYSRHLLTGVISAAVAGLTGWGMTRICEALDPTPLPISPLPVGLGMGLVMFVFMLIGLLPGSFFHRIVRYRNLRRFWHARQQLLQQGILKSNQRSRVELTPEGFTEALEYREVSAVVEIQKIEVSKIRWEAVPSIEVTEEHAFFQVANPNAPVKSPVWLILPRSAFVRRSDFRAFVDKACQYRDAVVRTPAPSGQLPPRRETRIKG